MATLTIIRGWQGSGKSTLANKYTNLAFKSGATAQHFEADMYFNVDGEYKFDASKLSAAHKWCQKSVSAALASGIDEVYVANTFRTVKEILPYLKIAKSLNAKVYIEECTGNYQNVHGVPQEIVDKYKAQFVPNRDLAKMVEFAGVVFKTV